MLDILVITKRQYTNKDLLDDHYGRIREIPLNLALKGHRVSGICLSFRRRPEGIYTDGGVNWKSINAGVFIIPGLARFARHAFQSLINCDVLWACSDSIFGLIGYILSRRLNKPLVFDLYDNFETFLFARFPVFKALYRHAVRRCDAVTVVSRPLLELVYSYGRGDRVYLIENAVDPQLFFAHDKVRCRSQFRLPQQARIIGTAGSLSKGRGIQTLYKSFQMLALKHPDIHLALAGPRDAPVPDHPRIHDMGNLEYDQIPLFLSAIDVGIICNRKDAFGTYCFPQKAREMMACNVPLVAANVEGTRSLFSNHPEWLFTPDDPVHLAQVVESRLNNKTTDYGSVSTWSDMAVHLEKIFFKLTAPRTE
jgi:glycosyltransferase involved in cell wall biosynthesis